jgi:DeoR/GlpR family transcriptional regulator of sugar metabolism
VDAKTRRDHIEQRVRSEREVGYAELAADFDVSEMTIRRDVEALESIGVVRRIVGGAIALKGKDSEPAFATRVADAAEEKSHIADAVADLIGPNETLILDSGSTALAVARSLRGRRLGLTVVTPSLLAALELIDQPDTTVVLTGGELRPGELSLIGPAAEESLAGYNCDTYVMGVAGIDDERGISDYHQAESGVKRAASRRADRVIVAADNSKLGRVTFVRIAALSQVDVIVTDGDPDHPALIAARTAGVDVVCVASHAHADSDPNAKAAQSNSRVESQ